MPETGNYALTRRRLLATAAAAGGLTLLAPASAGSDRLYRWQGRAMGARVAITLGLPSLADAVPIIEAALSEIDRLEDIFSLYRPDSELSRLNRAGRLVAPSPDLLDLLSLSHRFGVLSDGAFDVSVQPLWELHRRGAGSDPSAVRQARRLVDYRAIELDRDEVRFGRPGMQVTLNGIAQGYIADRVASWLAGAGLTHALLDLGEVRTLGGHPEGRPWRIGLSGHDRDRSDLLLKGGALATSSRHGLVFDQAGRQHHIFDPGRGTSPQEVASVTVEAADATTADALSTALMVTPFPRLRPRLETLAPLAVHITGQSGRTARWRVAG